MLIFVVGTVVFALGPVLFALGYFIKDVWTFLETRTTEGLALWQVMNQLYKFDLKCH